MVVAEQVVAALEGGLVTNAVNIPDGAAPRTSRCSGRTCRSRRSSASLAMELAGGETRRIGIEVYGELAEHDTRLPAPSRR